MHLVNTTTAETSATGTNSHWGVIASIQHHVRFLGLMQYYTLRLKDGTCLRTGGFTESCNWSDLPFAAPGDRVYYVLEGSRLTTLYVYHDQAE